MNKSIFVLTVVAFLTMIISPALAPTNYLEGKIGITSFDEEELNMTVIIFHTSTTDNSFILGNVQEAIQGVVDEQELTADEIKNKREEIEDKVAERVSGVQCLYIQKIKSEEEKSDIGGTIALVLFSIMIAAFILVIISTLASMKSKSKPKPKNEWKGKCPKCGYDYSWFVIDCEKCGFKPKMSNTKVDWRSKNDKAEEERESKKWKGNCPKCGYYLSISIDRCVKCNFIPRPGDPRVIWKDDDGEHYMENWEEEGDDEDEEDDFDDEE